MYLYLYAQLQRLEKVCRGIRAMVSLIFRGQNPLWPEEEYTMIRDNLLTKENFNWAQINLIAMWENL